MNCFCKPSKNILHRTRYSMVESPQHLVGTLPQLQSYTVMSEVQVSHLRTVQDDSMRHRPCKGILFSLHWIALHWMVISRVSSFSLPLASLWEYHIPGKGSLHPAHHFFAEIGSHTAFFYLLILQEGIKDCNVYHSLIFVQWQVLSVVVVALVLSKIYKYLQEKRPCHTSPCIFINSGHFIHLASWTSRGIQYSAKMPLKIVPVNRWIYSYLCKKKLLAYRLLKTYLVKCGLRNRVVFYVESLFVLGENTEYSGQGR